MGLVEIAIRNARLTISILVFLMLAGAQAYVTIPKEAEPDIQIPIIYVSMTLEGVSPEDSTHPFGPVMTPSRTCSTSRIWRPTCGSRPRPCATGSRADSSPRR